MAGGIPPGVPTEEGTILIVLGLYVAVISSLCPPATPTKVKEAMNKGALLSVALTPLTSYCSGSPPPPQKGFCVLPMMEEVMLTD